jgi:hypothetical protein
MLAVAAAEAVPLFLEETEGDEEALPPPPPPLPEEAEPALLAVLLPRALRVSVGEADLEGVAVAVIELQALLLTDCVAVMEKLGEAVALRVGVTALLPLLPPPAPPPPAVPLGPSVPVTLTLRAREGETVVEAHCEGDRVTVVESVAEGEALALRALALARGVLVPEPPPAPTPRRPPGVPLPVAQAQAVGVAVRQSVEEALAVAVAVAVAAGVRLTLALALALRLPSAQLGLPVCEAEALLPLVLE